MKPIPLRICHLVSGDGWGGLEAVVLNLICGQTARRELEPSLVILNEGRLARLAREAGLPVRVVPETGMNVWKLARALDRVLSDLAPTIIHTHRYKEQFLSYILAWRHGARCVATIHGCEPPSALSDRLAVAIRDTINFILARLVKTRFVAVSEDLRQRYRVSPERCTIIPNGIRVQDLTPRPEIPMKTEQSSATVIGWIGRMVPVKGLTTLLDAVAEMSVGSQPLRVLLVGDGPERMALEARAERLGIKELVHFVGFVSNPESFLMDMDIFALPSLHEGIPMVLLEAFAAGVPVVASAVGGIPDMIGDSDAAYLVPSSSPEAWAAALTELIADREKARMMGKQGRRLVEEHFSIESVVKRYIEVYYAAVS